MGLFQEVHIVLVDLQLQKLGMIVHICLLKERQYLFTVRHLFNFRMGMLNVSYEFNTLRFFNFPTGHVFKDYLFKIKSKILFSFMHPTIRAVCISCQLVELGRGAFLAGTQYPGLPLPQPRKSFRIETT